jgi:hypothetical protein
LSNVGRGGVELDAGTRFAVVDEAFQRIGNLGWRFQQNPGDMAVQRELEQSWKMPCLFGGRAQDQWSRLELNDRHPPRQDDWEAP